MKTVKHNEKIQIDTLPIGSLSCNATLIHHLETKEAVLVDPGDKLEEALSLLEQQKLNLKMILHTHAHFDHIACSDDLRDKTNASLHLHEEDNDLFMNLQAQGMLFGFNLKAPKKGPDHFFKDRETYSFLEYKNILEVFHTPGHTPGSSCFYINLFDTPILLSGDTLFHESIGRTDLPGGSYKTIIKSIKNKILSLPEETIVIPGHGPHTTIAHEKQHNPFLNNLFR